MANNIQENNNEELNEELTFRNLFSALSDISQELKLLRAKINDLNNNFVDVRETVNEIKNDVKLISNIQEKTQQSCKNMDGHIEFVEKTYDYLSKSTPLSYMATFKEKLWPRKSLETFEDKKDQ